MAKLVTIEDLIKDPEPVEIPTGKRIKAKGGTKDEMLVVYLRRPSELELRLIREAASGARRRLRAELEDPKTEKHQLLLREPLESAARDELESIWIAGRLHTRIAEINLDSLEEREYVPEPEGDLVSAADQDGYEDAVENAEDERVKAVSSAIHSVRRELDESVKKLSDKELVKAAMPAHTETLCQQEFLSEFSAQTVARCTFLDKHHSKPFFKTTEQAKQLRDQRPNLYQRLVNEHNGLLLTTEPSLGN